MVARHLDSLACYASITDINTAGWTAAGTTPSYQTAGGRWGTGAVRLSGSAGSPILVRTFTGLSAWVVGWVGRWGALSTSNPFIRFMEGSTTHVDLRWDASGHLIVTRNGTPLTGGTSTTVFNTGIDYVIQVKFTIHDSTGAVEVWINDNQEINISGLDTRNGATGVVDTFQWQTTAGAPNTHDISEVYIFDTTGSVNNAIAGSYRIYPRRVSAAGDYQQWTPSASTNPTNVDDAQGNDGDTTYNSSSTAGHIDTYQLGAVPWSSGTIAAILHRIVSRKDDAGVRTIRPKQRQSSTDYNGTSQNITTAYAHYTEVVETNPSTAAAFTTSEMVSTSPEFGYELVA